MRKTSQVTEIDCGEFVEEVMNRWSKVSAIGARVDQLKSQENTKEKSECGIVWKELSAGRSVSQMTPEARIELDYLQKKAEINCGYGMNPVEYLLLKDGFIFKEKPDFHTSAPEILKNVEMTASTKKLVYREIESTADQPRFNQSKSKGHHDENSNTKFSDQKPVQKKLNFTDQGIKPERVESKSITESYSSNPLTGPLVTFGKYYEAPSINSSDNMISFSNQIQNFKASNASGEQSERETARFESSDKNETPKSYLKQPREKISSISRIEVTKSAFEILQMPRDLRAPIHIQPIAERIDEIVLSSTKSKAIENVAVAPESMEKQFIPESTDSQLVVNYILDNTLDSNQFNTCITPESSRATLDIFFTPAEDSASLAARMQDCYQNENDKQLSSSESRISRQVMFNSMQNSQAVARDNRDNQSLEEFFRKNVGDKSNLTDSPSKPIENTLYTYNTIQKLFCSPSEALITSPSKSNYKPSAENSMQHLFRQSNRCKSPVVAKGSIEEFSVGTPSKEVEISQMLSNSIKESRVLSPSQIIELDSYNYIPQPTPLMFSSLDNSNATQIMKRPESAASLNYEEVYMSHHIEQSSGVTEYVAESYANRLLNHELSYSQISQICSIPGSYSKMSPLAIELRPSGIKCCSSGIKASENEISAGNIEIHMFDSNQGIDSSAKYHVELNTPSK